MQYQGLFQQLRFRFNTQFVASATTIAQSVITNAKEQATAYFVYMNSYLKQNLYLRDYEKMCQEKFRKLNPSAFDYFLSSIGTIQVSGEEYEYAPMDIAIDSRTNIALDVTLIKKESERIQRMAETGEMVIAKVVFAYDSNSGEMNVYVSALIDNDK